MNVLLASNIDGITNQYPTDLGDVIKQLQGMLNYKSYSNVATAVQRVRPGSRGIGLNGSAEVAARILEMERSQMANYDFRARALNVVSDSSGGYTAQLVNYASNFCSGSGRVGRNTPT